MRLARPLRCAAELGSASVDLTRRRGDAEKDAEKNKEIQNLRAQRQRSQWAWWQRGRVLRSATRPNADQPSTLACASLRSVGISADSAFSGFDSPVSSPRLSPRLRVSASPRQIDTCRAWFCRVTERSRAPFSAAPRLRVKNTASYPVAATC